MNQDQFLKRETPYDRLAKGEIGIASKKYSWFKKYSSKINFLSNLFVFNLWGHIFCRKKFTTQEEERFLNRQVNLLGGNILSDYLVAQYYKDTFLGSPPILEIGVADGCASWLFYPHLIIDEGIEYVQELIDMGHKNSTFKNVKTVTQGSAYQLPFDNNVFNLVLMNSVIHHLDRDRNFGLKEIFRVLQPGGQLIFSTQSEFFFQNRCPKAAFLKSIGLKQLSISYAKKYKDEFLEKYMNISGISINEWKDILKLCGFELDHFTYQLSPLQSFFYTHFYDRYSRFISYGFKLPQNTYPGLRKFFKLLLQSKNTGNGSLLFITAKKPS